ncbi:PP2C family protein-serine/threonine phosphatase [Microbacterium karelineae]|uniref:PP2C family protein-serine/threonine phosphatase n=1 Tax=Microbacterium karelineae TaxID=2654283 RepID=UPI0018D36651|nr:protein phosphatase 2C domain-containing protein [Microbacterium karelineae]
MTDDTTPATTPRPETHSRDVPLADGGSLSVRWAGSTDRGRKRENNQDSFLTAYPLFVVADGMGGHIGGEIASQSVVNRLEELAEHGTVSPHDIDRALTLAVSDISDHPDTTDEGTGTTITGIYLDVTDDGPSIVALNIGDSRVYLQRGDQLMQVTTDHSLVQELVAAGRLSEDEAETHPYSNVITRAVGPTEAVTPDYVRIDVQAGDRYVICSDGLTKELTDYGILHFLHANDDPADATAAMMVAALENGGRDNVSIVVVDIVSAPSTAPRTQPTEI